MEGVEELEFEFFVEPEKVPKILQKISLPVLNLHLKMDGALSRG